jgi:hypothetical protein
MACCVHAVEIVPVEGGIDCAQASGVCFDGPYGLVSLSEPHPNPPEQVLGRIIVPKSARQRNIVKTNNNIKNN